MVSSDPVRLKLHSEVLATMFGSRPKNLEKAFAYHADDLLGAEPFATEKDFLEVLRSSSSTDQLVVLWRKQLTDWDFKATVDWSEEKPRTAERRRDVYRLLAIRPETSQLLDSLIPVFDSAGPVVISEKFTPWYLPPRETGRSFYWPAYRSLLVRKGWPAHAVAGLDDATDRVVERLANPTADAAYQSKGLVVGYVQSGKTANFTGVIAKAVDAGYRLVIVLGGTLNMLREQTQRRLDMELIGRENILRGANEFESDYADDPDWGKGKFVSFGEMPSLQGAFDIFRMTTRDDDYKSLLQGIMALEFEKREPNLPLYNPKNLHRSNARLMVVKKNKTVLGKLVKDLKKIKTDLREIPVLIIDDESDEASLNTTNMGKPNAERTAINLKISELLRMLPRAQYVGYTATPFANVFVDPADAEDIFPKDFLISLPRPDGYMGVRDFHDIDSEIPLEERNFENSNEKAHVRDLAANEDGDDTDDLQRALDMFVLTAAMKIYREENDPQSPTYKHHTMLINESRLTEDHRELSGRITKMWWDSGYTGPTGHDRLRLLYDSDIAPVSAVRSEGYAVPDSFDDLQRYIGAASQRIGGDDRPILVINSDKELETGAADFDKRPIWKILIGGQKLSRGFTVEGLTVSYFRRATANASTMMQMGRWFGFRRGYRDLVRLYIGRQETMGAKDVDLYQAFEAICLDEEKFREELQQYSVLVDGEPQVTPAQVPPLVSQHLPWLKPTSANKMYNAKLVEVQSPGQWVEPTAYPSSPAALRHNTSLWLPILESLNPEPLTLTADLGNRGTFPIPFLTGTVSAPDFLTLAESLKWGAPSQFEPHLEYLRRITKHQPLVEDWLILAPQHVRGENRFKPDSGRHAYSWFARDRRRQGLFGAISDPKHRAPALRIAGPLGPRDNALILDLARHKQGVIVLYPLVEKDHRDEVATGTIDPAHLTMAFCFVAPYTAMIGSDRVIRFTTIDSSKDTPIIDAN
ncbi:Z1 domain-containing protein [Nocardia concava]|uniref:Z1 domain-containing protein n=1 Tax=Nocardia concava TaxID=257281 RepID=UPI0005939933|nr:Z1 domain-containing protein [Nocardia concava]